MRLDYQKELAPVLYDSSAVKIIENISFSPNILCFSMHWHERMEVLIVFSGVLYLHIGDTVTKAHGGEIAIITPEKLHMGVTKEEGAEYATLMFDITSFYNSANITGQFLEPIVNKTVDFITTTDNPVIFKTVNSILTEYNLRDSVSPIKIVSKIYELIGLLYQNCLYEKPYIISDDRLKNVIDFINSNFCNDLSSASLCRHFGYDEAYFCRRFKSVTGFSPMTYIQILRLEEAKKQIKNTKLKIAEIATNCGFPDPNYFTRCFKRYFGITPTAYAKKNF